MSIKKIIYSIVGILITFYIIDSACGIFGDKKKAYRKHIETIEENFNAVNFAQGKAELTYKAKSVLNDLVKYMKDNPDLKIKLEGHTSEEGDENFNQKLSEARAKVVLNSLVSQGISADRLQAEGKGSKEPIDPNNRRSNRRTEFIVIK